MEYIMQIFGNITLSTVIILIAAIAFIVKISIQLYKFIVKNHDLIQEREQVLVEVKDDLKKISQRQSNFEESMTTLLKNQEDLAARQEAIEASNRTHNLNKLRDRLLQNYNYYCNKDKNPLLAWSEMEKDVFDKLFSDYEELGGNGFMHTTVQPAMSTLTVVLMSDPVGLANLMQSRKG